MRWLLLLFLLMASTVLADVSRTYALYIPEGYDPEMPIPLLIALHPSGGDAQSMARITGFNELAEQEKFIVLYPEGPYGYWDYGAGTPQWEPIPRVLDDPAYLRDVLAEVEAEYNIDPMRIYAAGFSNGARMAFRLACDLPDKIAAIAAVAATISDEVTPLCDHGKPVSVLFMHGTADPVIPAHGKPLYTEGIYTSNALSAKGTAKFWAEHNGCGDPETETITSDDRTIDIHTYSGCNGSAETVFYEVQKGRHVWDFTDSLHTSELVWQFFLEHPKEVE